MSGNGGIQEVLGFLDALVAFPSVSSASNSDLVEWIKAALAPTGACFRRTFDDGGGKSNIVASLGPLERPGIVLSGHLDVVPVDGQAWTSDPFRLRLREGRAYGRGTADMKGFIACCLAKLGEVDARRLKRPIHLALSYDEELGCLGAPRMVADLARGIPTPELTIVGEPTMMKIVTAHKGVRVFETHFHGTAAHSSQSHLGISANVHAAHFITYLDRLFARMRSKVSTIGDLVPPYSTFNVGIVQGGTALNIIPENARLLWEFRYIPELSADAIARNIERHLELRVAAEGCRHLRHGGVTSTLLAQVPPMRPSLNREARSLFARLTGRTGDHAVAFGTEAGIFQDAGFPALVCGPGSIEVAHRADEHVALSQLAQCIGTLGKIVEYCTE